LRGIAFQYLPGWLFLAITAILIELDQARTWRNDIANIYDPESIWIIFDWFKRLDTWLDLAADALAIILWLLLSRI